MKIRQAAELMRDNTLVKHRAGSHAYGTAIATSDEDFRGIFCADPVNVRTLYFPVKECDDVNEEDTKLYEFSHFMKLCTDCNPNIIETLWVDMDDIMYYTTAYTHLRSYRQKLLSSKIAFTTSGYAFSQLKRIKGHNKWINNPQPEEAPKPKDFVSVVQWFGEEKNLKADFRDYCADHRMVSYGRDIYGVVPEKGFTLFGEITGQLHTNIDDDARFEYNNRLPLMIVKFNKDVYKKAKEDHTQYWTWKNNRNETRSELEEEHGYDTKHAMHLVRLMRMGVEALRDGVIVVKRPDAQELLAIRNGAWTYDQLLAYAEEMDNDIKEVWYKKTDLPKKPDIKFAAQLVMEVQDLVWSRTGYGLM